MRVRALRGTALEALDMGEFVYGTSQLWVGNGSKGALNPLLSPPKIWRKVFLASAAGGW